MIGWLDILGKAFEFTVTKLAGHRLDLALDDRKRVCRSLLEFYELLVDLEELALTCRDLLGPVVAGESGRLNSASMRAIAKQADALSSRFLQGLSDLLIALEIVAPDLSALFINVRHGKGGGRSISSAFNGIDKPKLVVVSAEQRWSLQYLRPATSGAPSERTQYHVRFEDLLHQARQRPRSPEDEVVLWPPTDQPPKVGTDVFRDYVGRVEVVTIQPDDMDALRQLKSEADEQAINLAAARHALRDYIAKNYSLEDVLYVKGHQRIRL